MTTTLSIYLDLLRFGAAAVVFFSHTGSPELTGALGWQLRMHGQEAVVVFFVLSGLVIRHVTTSRETNARTYAVGRLARLYSVAIPALMVTMLLDSSGFSVRPELYRVWLRPDTGSNVIDATVCLLFVNQIWSSVIQFGSNSPWWSLGYEVPYYVIFGLWLFMPRPFHVIAATIVAIAVGPRVVMMMPLWLSGVWLHDRIASAAEARKRLHPLVAVLLFVLPLFCYFPLHGLRADVADIGKTYETAADAARSFLYFHAVGVLFVVHLFAFSALADRFAPLLARIGRPIRWLAGTTFTLYLVHVPVALWLSAQSPWRPDSWSTRALVDGGTLVVVFVLAEIGERRKRSWQRGFGGLLDRILPRAAV